MKFPIFFGLALASSAFCSVARAQDDKPTPLFHCADGRLKEVSGLAVSPKNKGIFWMHNDSGDTARVFAVNSAGKVAQTVNLEGVEAIDFEDISLSGGWVYLADCGDNFSVRENISIYRFREPKISAKSNDKEITLRKNQFERMILQFPDGSHNCESVAATPDGRLLLVAKDDKKSGFYVLDARWGDGAHATLRKIGAFQFGATGYFTKLATGADFSSDGRSLAVTTYAQIYQFALGSPFDFSTIKMAPTIFDLPPLKQCESVAFLADGHSVVVTSEGKNQPVFVVNTK